MAAWKECADIQTSDMLNLPTPKPLYENVIVSPSESKKIWLSNWQSERRQSGTALFVRTGQYALCYQ